MTERPRIVVLGSINMDLVATTPGTASARPDADGEQLRHAAGGQGSEPGRRGRAARRGHPHDL